jgi:manganese/zinc/iron transport system permease protein
LSSSLPRPGQPAAILGTRAIAPQVAEFALLVALLVALTAAFLSVLNIRLDDAARLVPQLWQSYVLRTVTSAGLLLGLAGGVLGSYAVLRGQSLLGDAVSHSALPGIYVAFMSWSLLSARLSAPAGGLPEARSLAVVLAGALASGLLASALILVAARRTRLHEDAALAVTLASFFGAGLMFRSWLQNNPTYFGNRAGLESFLYGSIATITRSDLMVMGGLTITALVIVAVLWKELKLLAFDPTYLQTLGYPARALDVLLTVLIVVSVIVGLQMVGVVLMSAMLIAPAAAARQWTDRLGVMVCLAALVGGAGALAGIVASTLRAGISTGPLVALYVSAAAICSIIVAPNRGLLWREMRIARQRQQFALDTLLIHLGQHTASGEAVTIDALPRQLSWRPKRTTELLGRAQAAGLVTRDARLSLTAAGETHVEQALAQLGGVE